MEGGGGGGGEGYYFAIPMEEGEGGLPSKAKPHSHYEGERKKVSEV